MNVAIINSYFIPIFKGGAENSINHLIRELRKCNNINNLIVISLSPVHKELTLIEDNGIMLCYIPYLYNICPLTQNRSKLDKILWYLEDFHSTKSFDIVLNLLVKYEIDIVNTNNLAGFSSSLLKFIHSKGYKIIHTIRDYYFMCLKGNLNHVGCNNKQGIICNTLTSLRKYNSNYVYAVVGNSKYILDLHLKNNYFKNSKIKRYIYNGFSRPDEIKTKKNKFYRIGYIGRICAEKGVELFIKSSLKVAPDHEIIIAGDGDVNYISKLKEKYTKVKFLGHVPSSEFYNSVDFVVVPSLWPEPLARTVFESFFYGLPVIGSNRGGIPESIEDNINGFIFNPEIENDLGSKIAKLAYDNKLYSDMRAKSFMFANKFDIENTVNNYITLYQEVFNDENP
ncbi:TPA: glycosyltransferase family 4 protein [Citrobacter braakii]|uniref:glycosyltransferase family 4 protein n=1 Tax=Citrobacter braakii TaxID=57706 RepID=UPI003D96E422|nr:glycosyltransferase family 4 protein [Citrobacter braakii]